jgi:hypothetical protein
MRRITSILLLITTSVLSLASHTLMAQSSEADVPNIVKRTQSAAEVLEEIMGATRGRVLRIDVNRGTSKRLGRKPRWRNACCKEKTPVQGTVF